MVVTHADNLAVTVEEDVATEMRDGTVLRADVYHPSGGGRYPVLVCRTPYWKRLGRYVNHARGLAARGYTAVVQDIRGRYASDGDFEWAFGDPELTSDTDDGYDTIEWAAAVKWSDGQAGTWGHSYPSWCIWQMAPTKPPHLKAIFASGMGKDILAMTNGVFETGLRLEWTYMMAADARRRAGDSFGPHVPGEATERWREMERGKWIWFLPLEEIPDHVFSTLTPLLKRYYRHQPKELWNFGAVHSQVEFPVYQFTGWWDRLIDTTSNFAGMVENGPTGLRDQHRLVIGPWGHNATQLHGRLGPVDYGTAANATYENLIARWFDYRFKGLDNGLAAEPPIRLFVLNENTWRFENEWPLARTDYTSFFLHSDGSANTVMGDGSLSTEEPGGERPDEYEYDPRDPVMSMMGPYAQAAACDQAPLDGRRDVLVYQTPPLERELEVTGPVEVKLWAASTAPDTDFTAKLSVVYENGMAVNLTYGIVRARYRNGYDDEHLLQPGQPVEYTIRLNPTGILFRPGQRIRLDVASADFPNFDRNHNTGANFWEDAELRTARQTVFHDRARSSRVVLPVIPRRATEKSVTR